MKEQIFQNILDLDGTIMSEGKVPQSIKDGLVRLREKDIKTTILTSRGYRSLYYILGKNWQDVVSDSQPVGLENGGRITDYAGGRNLVYHPLSADEIDDITEFLSNIPVQYCAYFPEDLQRRAVVWTHEFQTAQYLGKRFGHFSEVLLGPFEKFTNMVRRDSPCMVSVKPSLSGFRDKAPDHLNIAYNGDVYNINSQGVDKRLGVKSLCEILARIEHEVTIAGNDENDIPMFHTSAGIKIAVGPLLRDLLPKDMDIVYVESPHELGIFLSSM